MNLCKRRIRDKLAAEYHLRVPRNRLKAREVAELIREKHPRFRGRSIWQTIGGFVRWRESLET